MANGYEDISAEKESGYRTLTSSTSKVVAHTNVSSASAIVPSQNAKGSGSNSSRRSKNVSSLQQKTAVNLSGIFDASSRFSKETCHHVLDLIEAELNINHPKLNKYETQELHKKISALISLQPDEELVFDFTVTCRSSHNNVNKPVYNVHLKTSIGDSGNFGTIKLPFAQFKRAEDTQEWAFKKYNHENSESVKKIYKEIMELSTLAAEMTPEERLTDIENDFKKFNASRNQTVSSLRNTLTLISKKFEKYISHVSLLEASEKEFEYIQTAIADEKVIASKKQARSFHNLVSMGMFAMPNISGINLEKMINENRFSSEFERFETFVKVYKSLRNLHAKGIVHHDLRPPNIMIDNKGNVKIVDMGLANKIGEPKSGSFNHVCISPESAMIVNKSHEHTVISNIEEDNWSLGLLLATMYGATERIWEVTEATASELADLTQEAVKIPSLAILKVKETAARVDAIKEQMRLLKAELLAISVISDSGNNINSDTNSSAHKAASAPVESQVSASSYKTVSAPIEPQEGSSSYKTVAAPIEPQEGSSSYKTVPVKNDAYSSPLSNLSVAQHALARLLMPAKGKATTEPREIVTSKPHAPLKITGVETPGFMNYAGISDLSIETQDLIDELRCRLLDINPKTRAREDEIDAMCSEILTSIKAHAKASKPSSPR